MHPTDFGLHPMAQSNVVNIIQAFFVWFLVRLDEQNLDANDGQADTV